jgi:preprotein translocase subunit SecD
MRSVTFIIIIGLLTLVINMPRELKLGGKTLYRPVIDFSFAGRRIYRDLDARLGLDLKGGAHLVYQADTANIPESDRDPAMEAAKTNIENRINMLGVSESVVQTAKVGEEYRLIVEMPGVSDINQAIAAIGRTALLDFREPAVATPSSEADFVSAGLTGSDLKIAQVQFNNGDAKNAGQPVVSLEFNAEGTRKFSEITTKNLGKNVAIFLDDQLIMAPVVQSAITDGKAIVSGGFTVNDAKTLAIQLNAGALPVPIKIIEQRNVGATLGSESVAKSVVAGIIGLIVIWVFMLINYGARGLIANVALIIYVLVSLSIIKLVPVTLTLAGIAGLVLSIGMAVDANILIFERIKEELRWGRPLKTALDLGFYRAWSSIRDSNVSSLITAGILFWFGSGSVRGFALTLVIGILVSLFSSITVTKALLYSLYRK